MRGWGERMRGREQRKRCLDGGQFGVKENPDARQTPRKPQG